MVHLFFVDFCCFGVVICRDAYKLAISEVSGLWTSLSVVPRLSSWFLLGMCASCFWLCSGVMLLEAFILLFYFCEKYDMFR